MPALTRPFATAVHIDDSPSLFDELIESMGSTVRPLRLIPTILPSTRTALTLRPLCLRRAGSIASKLAERGRASRSIHAELGATTGRRSDTYLEAVQYARQAQLAERRRARQRCGPPVFFRGCAPRARWLGGCRVGRLAGVGLGVGRLVGWQGFWTCRVGPRRLWEVMGMVMGGSGELGCGVWGREGREGVGCEPPAQW